MKSNMPTIIRNSKDEVLVTRAQNRVLRLYARLKKKGGWRAVVAQLSLRFGSLCECRYPGQLDEDLRCRNCRRYFVRPKLTTLTVYNFAIHGVIPLTRYRKAVFLPKRLPSERRPYAKRIPPGLFGWEDDYMHKEGMK